MDSWNEIRTVSYVARLGTVTRAAEALGVHRATVIRHIDSLEAHMGEKLFQRHARGYTPTDAGLDLLRVADATEDQFSQLFRRVRHRAEALEGELIITALDTLTPLLLPVLNTLQARHPGLTVRFLGSVTLLRLEYGEAHVAFRAGEKPDDPDNIARLFTTVRTGLYASAAYVARYGCPGSVAEFAHHRFVGPHTPQPRAPYHKWMEANIPKDRITFRGNHLAVLEEAVLAGTGIGFLPESTAHAHPGLVQVTEPQPEWATPVWRVTHVDLHRSAKVQAFLGVLKEVGG